MIGEVIHKLRTARNLSQTSIAASLGVTKQTFSNWENNNILPSIDMLVRLSAYFSVSTDYLLELDDRTFLEVSGLTPEQIAHIQLIINDIQKEGR